MHVVRVIFIFSESNQRFSTQNFFLSSTNESLVESFLH